MLLKAHQGQDQVRVMVRGTAKAICQCLGWDRVMALDWVKYPDTETVVMIHLKTLLSKAEAMESSLIQPRVKVTLLSEQYLFTAVSITKPLHEYCMKL